MITPGLERISLLLKHSLLPWKSIHVAGTNGKGSTCAYISAMLRAANIKSGRFCSPHLIDRWDCITINETPVSSSVFHEVEAQVKQRNATESIQASEFELLTATAFQIFTREKIEVGVVECGMGGRLDATNVLKSPLVSVITRIGLDHQAFLGKTLQAIAHEKAGIMKHGTPCVVDAQDKESTLRVLQLAALSNGVNLHVTPKPPIIEAPGDMNDFNSLFQIIGADPKDIEVNQQRNMWCAYKAIVEVLPAVGHSNVDVKTLAPVMKEVQVPGRLQTIDIEPLTGRAGCRVLLDGAHNLQAFIALGNYVNQHLRGPTAFSGIVWIVALSEGKEVMDLFGMISRHDFVLAVEFGPVAGMPWVKPIASADIVSVVARRGHPGRATSYGSDIHVAIRAAAKLARDWPIVIAGSLYLVSDVLRMLRDASGGNSQSAETPSLVYKYLIKNSRDPAPYQDRLLRYGVPGSTAVDQILSSSTNQGDIALERMSQTAAKDQQAIPIRTSEQAVSPRVGKSVNNDLQQFDAAPITTTQQHGRGDAAQDAANKISKIHHSRPMIRRTRLAQLKIRRHQV